MGYIILYGINMNEPFSDEYASKTGTKNLKVQVLEMGSVLNMKSVRVAIGMIRAS